MQHSIKVSIIPNIVELHRFNHYSKACFTKTLNLNIFIFVSISDAVKLWAGSSKAHVNFTATSPFRTHCHNAQMRDGQIPGHGV